MNPLAAAATTIPTPHPPLAAASACRQAKPASGSRGRLAHILRWSVGMCVLLRVEVVVPALCLLLAASSLSHASWCCRLPFVLGASAG